MPHECAVSCYMWENSDAVPGVLEIVMPYYVFRITADKALTLVSAFDKYKDAKETCRNLRIAEPDGGANHVRMAFAATERDAKRLLADKRQPQSPLEEWEA